MRQNFYLFVRQFPTRSSRIPSLQARNARAASALLVAVAASCALSQTARAATYVVDRTDDGTQSACTSAGNDCSLRGAIIAANASAGADSIELVAGQTYALSLGGSDSEINARVATKGDLDITDSVAIRGNGATVNGGGIDRVFDIGNAGGAALSVTMSDLTISGGVAKGFLSYGGGINVRGAALNLARCVVRGNSSGTFNGGGIAVNSVRSSAQAASLSLALCTVENNSGYNGGGIEAGSASVNISQSLLRNNTASGTFGGGGLFICGSGATASLSNSTLFENKSSSNGGGIAIYAGTLNVQHSTIASNSATGSGARGGGIDNGAGQGGVLNFGNSVLASNIGGDGAGTLAGDYNLIQNASGLTISGANNITGQNPKLGALAANDGTTQSLAPQTGSPLIDKAGPSSLTTDQSGATRPFDFLVVANASGGNGSDIGAIEAQNMAPTLVDIAFVTNEDVPRAFAASNFDNAFTDANNDIAQSVRIVGLPTQGVLTLNSVAVAANQTIARADFAKLSYAPNANFNGTDSFAYNLSDGALFAASNASVNIVVNSVNDAPSFTLGANQVVNEDAGAQNVALFATNLSTGPANESGQTLTFSATNNNNALFSSQPTINASGILTYTPAPNANGSATVSVTLQDNGGTANGGVNASATQTFFITVNAVNDAPSFTVGANQTVNEDGGAQSVAGFATNISAGPTNESAQKLSFSVTTDNNALFSVAPAISAAGTLSYTPAPNASGSATVSVTLQDDGDGTDTSTTQTFTIAVNSVNDAPSFALGANQTVNEDAGAQSVANFVTDISTGPANESGQTLTFNATNDNNALFSSQPTINASGILTYTPAPNANGSATVSVTLRDNGGTDNGGVNASATQTFIITVNAVNDVPTITGIANQIVNEDAKTGALSFTIGDVETATSALTVTATSSDTSLVPNANLVLSGDAADRTLTVTPAPNANGTATITVAVSDGSASKSTSFELQINAVNDAPSFTVGANQTVNEDSGAQSVAGFATNISAGPTNESAQKLSFSVTTDDNALFSVAPAISAAGTLSYTPAPNASGSATVSVTLQDDGGTANGGANASATQTFTIVVGSVNDAPIGVGDNYQTGEDSVLVIAATEGVLSNDSDVDNSALQAVLVSSVSNGTLTLNKDGSFSYAPNANFNGNDSFSYQASDGALKSGTVTVGIAVGAVNDAPVATPQSVSTNEDTAAPIVLSATDADSANLTYRVVSGPGNGTLSGSAPNLTYTPNANFNGTDSFTFLASDGTLESNTATISIAVNAVNDAPVAVADAYALDQNTTLNVPIAAGVLNNDRDVDNATLAAILDTGVAHGTLTLNSDGSFSYVPTVGYRGEDNFSYHANDGQLKSNIVTVKLTVRATPQPINFGVSIVPKSPATNDVLTATPVILDGQGVSYSYAWSVGNVVKQNGASNVFDLNIAGNGDKGQRVSVVVTATRGIDGGSATNFVDVRNSAPFAFSQSGASQGGVPTQFTLRGADLDAEVLTYKSVGGPSNGTATITNNADGTATLTYTARRDFGGVETIRFVSIDQSGRASQPATLSINVTRAAPAPAPNRAPSANNVTASTKSGVLVKVPLSGSDPDGDALTFKRVGGPSNGTGEIARDSDGIFKMFYTSRAGFVGNEIIRFVALDTTGKPSAVATITINVSGANAPSAGNS